MIDATWTFAVIFMAIFGALATFAVLWVRSEHDAHRTEHARTAERRPRSATGRAKR